MFTWQSKEGKAIHSDYSYSEAVNEWLNQIDVPLEVRPNYSECLYWYDSQDDSSEIIILWDKHKSSLYIVESFI